MQTESLRERRGEESGAGPRPHHSTAHSQQSMPTSESHPVPPTSTHSPTQTSNPASPHPPPLPTGNKIKATKDTATVLSLLGKTEPLSSETGRTGELMGWPHLGPPRTGVLALLQAPHHPCIHIRVPPRALAKACSISIRTRSD